VPYSFTVYKKHVYSVDLKSFTIYFKEINCCTIRHYFKRGITFLVYEQEIDQVTHIILI